VIGASRDPADLALGIRCLAPTGHLSNISILFGDTPLPLWEMYLRDVSFSTGIPNVGPHIPKVLELARCGHIHPERVMTVYDWKDAPEALLCNDFKPVVVRAPIFGGTSSDRRRSPNMVVPTHF
jgi:alcohol dehydrogenase